jgi:hypothetical protein
LDIADNSKKSTKKSKPMTQEEFRIKANIRFVTYKGTKYLRIDDVINYILELSSGEETDVRQRIESAAKELLKDTKS